MSEASQDESTQRKLQQQVAIVTGGASGIGRATCRALKSQGAHVVAVDVNEKGLNDTLAQLRELSADDDTDLILRLDVGSERDMETMARETVASFGRIDVLVGCAGSGCHVRRYSVILTKWCDYRLGVGFRC